MNEQELERARLAAIKQVAGAERFFLLCVVLTALCEAIFLVCLFWQMDWSDPVQRLIVISTGLVYGTLGMAVLALGAYQRWWALRIVRAIQLGPEE